jgi:hypothetical protein
MVKVIGELIESIAGRAGLKNVREVGESLTKSDKGQPGGRAGELVDALLDVIGSDLLDYGQSLIAGLKNTTGQGDPERGDVFGRTQSTFNGVNETLKSAVPDDGWDGSGAHAYADQNTRQQLRSAAMADADHEVHKVLYREAAQITLRRGYLDDQSNFLANTSYVTFPLQFIPRYGEAMKMAVEIAALQTTLGESYHQMSQLQSEVAQNAAELQQAVGRYSGVADGAELPGAAVYFDPPPPPPGGGALPSTIPMQRAQQSAAPGAIARPMITATGPAPQPVVAGLPPLPLPPLASPLSPLGGLVTGAMPAAGQPAATPSQRRPKKAARPRDDEETTDSETDEDKDPTKAASGDAEPERAPVDPVAVKLDPDNPTGPPTATPPQSSR